MQPLATMEPAPEPEPLARPSVARRTCAAAWLRAADRAELDDKAHGDARHRLVRAPPPFALARPPRARSSAPMCYGLFPPLELPCALVEQHAQAPSACCSTSALPNASGGKSP